MTALPELARQTRISVLATLSEVDPEAADWARSAGTATGTPTVVLVGETNRGKSSLLNALLASPGLSPVDAGLATARYLTVRHGAEWSARAEQLTGDPIPVPVEALPDWLLDPALPARSITVTAPIPLLANVTLVDTPGVGGLDQLHRELAVEAAAGATALLFVVDASAPLSAGELDFLTVAAERVDTVLFAVTKTDQFRGWAQIAEANRELLNRHVPRFAGAEFHPVSARLFELASGEQAALLRDRSGIPALQELVQRTVAGRAAMLSEANGLRAVHTALEANIATLSARHRTLTSGAAEAEALRSRREELTAQRRGSTRGWQVRLRGEIQKVRVDLGHELARQVRDLQSWFRRTVDSADKQELAAVPQRVDSALGLVARQTTDGLGARLDTVVTTALGELFDPAELAVTIADLAMGRQPAIVLRPPEDRPSTPEDRLLVLMGVSGGLGIGRAAALPLAGLGVGLLNPIVLPVTMALGLGAGWWMARTRRHTADKHHMKLWITESIAEVRSVLDQLISEQLIDAELRLSLALEDATGRRIEDIEAQLREVDRALRLDAAERSAEAREISTRLSELTAASRQVAVLLRRIAELK
ncbi:dynamin [Pseudonocardiaceae bacterium YIM PH 21723]|nr:dynamin [Pseudonocardiaceae bacterium YIM PH 21723]